MIAYMTQIDLVQVMWNSTHTHTMLLVQMQFNITWCYQVNYNVIDHNSRKALATSMVCHKMNSQDTIRVSLIAYIA